MLNLKRIELEAEHAELKEIFQEYDRKERFLSAINSFSLSLLKQTTTDEILWDVAKNVIAKLDLEDCVIYLLDEDGTHLVQKAAYGPKSTEDNHVKDPIKIPLGEGIVGTVAQIGIAEIINDTRLDKRYISDDENRLSEIAVPLIANDKIIGVIDSEHSKLNFFTYEHLEILTTIAYMTSIKIMQARAQEKLALSNAALEQYAYAASHDLKEPLRMITSFLQLVKMKEPNLSKESLSFMNFAIDGASRMKDLLDGILLYSKVNINDYPKQKLSLNDVLNDALSNLKLQIEQNAAVINLPKDSLTITGHKILLIQLFQNLLSNSIKFKKPRINPEISISLTTEADYYHFRVKDNGIGIKKDYRERVFHLFTRLNPRDKYQGSGIGLSLCKSVVSRHDGKIWIESGKGKGCEVHFTLKK